LNAYEQIMLLRELVVESSASHWTDFELLGRLNAAQRRLGLYVGMQPGGWLVKSASVTPVASEITWPADCAKPIYLEETTSGRPVPFSTGVAERRVSRLSGSSIYTGVVEAYFERKKIVVNQETYTEAGTLWYQMRIPDLHVGTAAAGAATSITLDETDGIDSTTGFGAKQVADYYNGMQIQVVAGTGAGGPDTISDYTAARVATVTGTYGADSDYGLISMLPEECHELMYYEAALAALSKPAAAVDPKYYEYLKDVVRELKRAFELWISSHVVGTARTRITETE
jgi:hypothetical protein